MATPRVTPVEPPYSEDVQAAFDKIMRGAPPLILFRTLAHNPRVLRRLIDGGLLDRGSISLRSRELLILRTCANCDAEYEWGVHVAGFGAKAQWTPEQLKSTVHGDSSDDCWSSEDRLVIRLADQLHKTHRVEPTLWQELSVHFATDQLVELVVLAGLYHAVSYAINAFGIQNESLAPTFPVNDSPAALDT